MEDFQIITKVGNEELIRDHERWRAKGELALTQCAQENELRPEESMRTLRW